MWLFTDSKPTDGWIVLEDYSLKTPLLIFQIVHFKIFLKTGSLNILSKQTAMVGLEQRSPQMQNKCDENHELSEIRKHHVNIRGTFKYLSIYNRQLKCIIAALKY